MRIALLSVCFLALSPAIASAEEKTGEQIYQQLCVRCHGAAGEGSKKAQPHGGASIAKHAPPGTCCSAVYARIQFAPVARPGQPWRGAQSQALRAA